MMNSESLRERSNRQDRLDDEWLHLFALDEMIGALRSEDAYEQNGHTGVLLLKTENLRLVLEVARKGNEIGQHSVAGPTAVQVLHGSICLESGDETRIAHCGEMIVVPQDRPRRLHAQDDAAFLWVLSLES